MFCPPRNARRTSACGRRASRLAAPGTADVLSQNRSKVRRACGMIVALSVIVEMLVGFKSVEPNTAPFTTKLNRPESPNARKSGRVEWQLRQERATTPKYRLR